MDARSIAVLFACSDSLYRRMSVCDVWDMQRDALTYSGKGPVIAHPPCRAWGRLRPFAKPIAGEKELALWAVDIVRRNGGVLEHPADSRLWPEARLPAVGQGDRYGGWTLVIDQNWWGHRARKRTRLYIVGCGPKDLPLMPLQLGEASHTVGLYSRRDRSRCRPEIGKRERERTPQALAEWLCEVASKCGNVR